MSGIKGAEIEIKMVQSLFKLGSFGFRAPGSGTYKVAEMTIPYTEDQAKCKIEIRGTPHIDFGYDTKYITADYTGYFPKESVGSVKSFGIFGEKEIRVVEAKTVRLRKNHLTKKEKELDRSTINRKEHRMYESFNLLVKDTRSVVKRPNPENSKKNIKVPNPYKDKLRKSNFCMELQRTWYLALVMRKNIAEMLKSININVDPNILPIYGYLQLRFVGSYRELWIRISELVKYQNSSLQNERDITNTMLYIIKDTDNNITWEWRKNQKYIWLKED